MASFTAGLKSLENAGYTYEIHHFYYKYVTEITLGMSLEILVKYSKILTVHGSLFKLEDFG